MIPRALAEGPIRQAGVSRAGVALAAAVVAAGLVLAGGALRSGLTPSPGPSVEPTGAGSFQLESLPSTPTLAPTIAASPTPPEPSEIPDLRGDYVGGLGHVEGCAILYERDGALELVLPDGYRSRIRAGNVQIIDDGGAVVAAEGDLIGVNGKVGGAGSACLAGPRLRVTKIVEVRPREAQ